MAEDPIAALQSNAAESGKAEWGHWGPQNEKYSSWTTHSNRLIPVYTFGATLEKFTGANSLYRDATKIKQLYGRVPENTLNENADYCDQTDIYHLQRQAIAAGKKRVVLFVFDGMDWQTTWAAAIAKSGNVAYREGRGTGLAFLDYRQTNTDFGYFVCSPHNNGTSYDLNRQIVTNPGGKTPGGYDPNRAGSTPWAVFPDPLYPIGQGDEGQFKHAYTDSASSATSLCSGIKTYNGAINVDQRGREVLPIARTLQQEGFAVGAVSSVPISHATPASAYANNVGRSDYQDLTRDMLGLPSVFHPGGLPGLDVAIGCGWGEARDSDGGQGENFVPGNRYLPDEELEQLKLSNGGKYIVAQRTPGVPGSEVLSTAVSSACEGQHRLFGFFGTRGGHLPFQTADGGYDPVRSVGNPSSARAEEYSRADVEENVTLAEMTMAAVEVLSAKSDRWWLLVEAGDVDWANHANNIDNSIGATLSGELAFHKVTRWIEGHGGWDDALVIVTADHGHYLILDHPEALAGK